VGGLLVVAVTIPLMLNVFTAWKVAMPLVVPFSWDRSLMEADYAIHFGNHPWMLMQPIVGHPPITRILDLFYGLWLPVNIGFVVWQAWSANRFNRMRFLLSYVLVWTLLGTALATGFSSAGPCYYTRLTGQDAPYGPLLDYLGSLHLIAVPVQDALWANYVSSRLVPFSGISAMPSIHVALPVLFAIASHALRPMLGWIFAAFAFLILVGSVHLGWHYALDGYVSIGLTILIWGATGRLLRRVSGELGLEDRKGGETEPTFSRLQEPRARIP
jgi:PAP2 superfamily